ncbi:S-formylglutathione hydrolase [Parvularcula dongshanensis]|uniref:S-formylglutathione hydrolase n=1 Tax=Parvularcula dongshanensis TaxID=1173995 RepID=A0A840I203_9PROT|nr:S-formylglutathione hydrolase [Parvularcula dongshanensis]MBB4658292.1 S-formylglutathione hydrolase [Parvularcula dongshanensis]
MKTTNSWKSFGGTLSVHEHDSSTCRCPMTFAVYTPPGEGPFPVLWYLSGLTCSWANPMEKSGLQAHAAKYGVMVVAPDTSPRGKGVADDEAYDLGQGAGFYLTATQAPWSEHYKMDVYVTEELQELVFDHFPGDPARQGVFGHSMGGHGALTLHLKNPDTYRSVSAFSPIVAPSQVPWGHKAFGAYLGEDRAKWAQYDASELVRERPSQAKILIDQGVADGFLEEQLKPELFEAACAEAGQDLTVRRHEGYDHSYYFIASFMGDHIKHHAEALRG